MTGRSPRALALALPALIAFAASTAHADWPHDPTVNVPLSVGPWQRQNQVAVSDGAGGMYVAWEDFRSGTERIYAQRVQANGAIAPGWAPNGNEVKTTLTTRSLTQPSICSDGAGGVVIVWCEAFSGTDHDIYAQRMNAIGGQVWNAGGVGVATSTFDQFNPHVVADGAGNVLIAWHEDHTSGGTGMDVYANRVGPNGVNRWGFNGVILCNATGDQDSPALVSDGAGGLDAAWVDRRGPNGIYAIRCDSTGVLHSGWTANGSGIATGNYGFYSPSVVANSSGGMLVVWIDDRNGANTNGVFGIGLLGNAFQLGFLGGSAICNVSSLKSSLVAASDGTDGAFAVWGDERSGGVVKAFAERLNSSGVIATGWPAPGVTLPVSIGAATPTGIVLDGVGGCIIALDDFSNAPRGDVFASHLTASGVLSEGWGAEMPVCTAIGDQFAPVCVSDGASGALLAWVDDRDGSSSIYAQNIDKWGALGNAAPAIVAVKDVPNDQGGNVRVSWSASYLDAYPGYAIGQYWLWRQVPASVAQAALRSGAARLLRSGETPVAGARVLRAGAQDVYWEFVASQIADAFSSYSLVAATLSDSTPTSNPLTMFMVEARGSGHEAWDSAPGSGYSVDNLAPPAPAPFAATYAAGVTSLHWSPPGAPDLANYRLYRGSSSGFVPGPGNLIGTPSDTTFADSPGGFYYYKVSAVDVHGNEGPTSLAFPSAATGAPVAAPLPLALLGAAPNPLREQSAIRWTQPREASVRVTLRDLAGRSVRSLLDGASPAGAHALRWDARDDAGRAVPDGIYFLELAVEGRVLRTRVAVVR